MSMERVAIIGLSCIFPGAHTPADFWHMLLDAHDMTSLVSADDLGIDDVSRYYAAQKGYPDRYYALRGGYVRDFVFDPTGYPFPPHTLQQLDPLFQWALSSANDALRDAEQQRASLDRSRCGMILGSLLFPTRASSQLFAPIYTTALEPFVQHHTRSPTLHLPAHQRPTNQTPLLPNALYPGSMTTLVAHALGLGGTHLTMDAACATSLYAIQLACAMLRTHKADIMLAGAVNCPDPIFMHMGFSLFQAYPPESSTSCPLDQTSQGLYSGEGAGVVVLKRESDALRDGDHIYATILGAGLSNDGSGKHVLMPNPKGQLLAFQRAYAHANIPPQTVSYVECHATGTPLGDVTELNSIETFFGSTGDLPHIGSVKSNLGHPLTAAGMAALLKTVMSMRHGQIPATINVSHPLTSRNQQITPHHIVQNRMPWPTSTSPRRAAINAFGFGGVNAHLILEHDSQSSPTNAPMSAHPPILLPHLAIVGMGALFGKYHTLDAFAHAMYDGQQNITPLPPHRWKGMEGDTSNADASDAPPHGAYIDAVDIDFRRLKLPPLETEQPISQHLLLLHVADQAAQDANLSPGTNVAVLVNVAPELALHQFRARIDITWQLEQSLAAADITLTDDERTNLESLAKESMHHWPQVNQYTSFIGNVIASRVAALWDFTGPAFAVATDGSGIAKTIELAQLLLAQGDADAVLVGAVDLAGGIERFLVNSQRAPLNTGTFTLGYDANANGWNVGEGAGAVVLVRHTDALDQSHRIYATIAACLSHGQDVCAQAHTDTNISPSHVGYLEVCGSGISPNSQDYLSTLLHTYAHNDTNSYTCAIGSAEAHIGYPFAAAGIASLIRTALCLAQRYIPGVPDWSAPADPAAWQHSRFYVANESRPWLLDDEQSHRTAAIAEQAPDGSRAYMLLAEEQTQPALPNTYRFHLSPYFFPLAGTNELSLQRQLDDLEHKIDDAPTIATIAHDYLRQCKSARDAPYVLTLIANTPAELRREIERARAALPKAYADGTPWTTPTGSYFTPKPLGGDGVAFAYPGAFNAYLGLGQHLLHLFPELFEQFGQLTSNMERSIGGSSLYLRRAITPSANDLKTLEAKLIDDSIGMLEIGTTFATLYTMVLRDIFHVRPTIAFGYSQGETAMMHALGVWHGSDEGSAALRASDLYQTRLSGPRDAAREYWQLDPPPPPDADIWANYIAMTSPERIRPLLEHEPRVYLAIINTPNQVMIAGDPEGCRRVIAQAKCRSLRAPFNHIIHSPPVQSEYDKFFRINTSPVHPISDIRCYSAATYEPISSPFTSETVAHSIAQVCCQPLDFPRLVERVYHDGARIFIEIGPARTIARWIETTLNTQPHVSLAINKRGAHDYEGILRALAVLLSHRVPMTLAPLIPPQQPETRPSLIKRITLGGERIATRFNAPEPINTYPRIRDALSLESLPMPMSEPTIPIMPSPTYNAPYDTLAQTIAHATTAHTRFLTMRHEAFQHLSNLVHHYVAAHHTTPPPTAPMISHEIPAPPRKDAIWNEDDLHEFATGTIAKVYGDDYASIDTYHRRVRLPTPPYLLVSRVTKLNATKGAYVPSTITTEYDIPVGVWYSVDGQIPWAVAVESGQCDLMLISYIGIDFECKGERVYRLLDCTLNFLDDLPKEGETLRYDISINSFARSGDTLLFFFSYDCFVGERLVLKMTGGCAGFFTDQELAEGKGVVIKEQELETRRNIQKRSFTPLLTCPHRSFTSEQIQALCSGNLSACFGSHYHQRGKNPSLRLPAWELVMADRITSIDPHGGDWGLGLLIAEQDLAPDHWYFPCHFKDDQVLAGSLMAEGCVQLLQFYMLFLGMQQHTHDARFQPIPNLPQVVVCRGQVVPTDTRLTYRLEITDLGTHPEPYAVGNVAIILDGKTVVTFSDLGLKLAEKQSAAPPPPPPVISEQQLTEFTCGSVVACFGDEYRIYDGRRLPRTPNGDLQLMSRIVDVDATRHDYTPGAWLVSEYDVPPDAWYLVQNAAPVLPYSILMEIALQPCGFLSAYLGSCLLFPDADLYFRNLDGHGTLHRLPDVRGKTVVNHARLLSSSSLHGVIIQKFGFVVSCDGTPFYEGESVFGYFTSEALANQVGLDNGAHVPLWYAQPEHQHLPSTTINLRTPATQALFHAPPTRPHERLAQQNLTFLDHVTIIPGGGQYEQGYIAAHKTIDPTAWFFDAHFYQDPVMPGSLGVEAMLQALHTYALHQGLGKHLISPYIAPTPNHQTIWKYRGQIVQSVPHFSLEIHLKHIHQEADHVTLIGDASLWRDTLRIYEIRNLALRIAESDT